jgi:tetratricopeptide (TPR) repeat protein
MRLFPILIVTALLTAAASAAPFAGHCDLEGCRSGDFDGKGARGSETDPGGTARNQIELVRLDSRDPDVRRSRDAKEQAKNDLSQIIVYYNAAIRREPKDDDAYFHRGIANFYAGDRPHALADLKQASRLDPQYPYYALWMHIIDTRSNAASSLPQAISQIDMTKWPAPVIRLFLGHATPAAVLDAAEDPDVGIRRGRVCEAQFYSAELALQQGDKKEAVRLFRLAAAGCTRDFVEGAAAASELNALDEKP